MQAADLETVAKFESELFTSASWSLPMLEQEFNGPDRTYVVWVGSDPTAPQNQQEAPEKVLGYAGIWCGNEDAEIMTIGVAKGAQHAGIGHALLQALIDTAIQKRCRRVLLEVRVDNEAAKNLYLLFGFRPMGLRRHYYQPEDVDALTMSLNLEEVGHE